MKVEQPRLGRRGTLALLIMLDAFPPLTMDLYLPALPQMAETFGTSHAMVNLTLGAYMVAFAVGMLFWGPPSERTGRKPILFATLGLYVTASLLCALAPGIEGLIGLRILQGFAGGGVTVIATTLVKDLFDGRERERVMGTIMSIVVIAPMVAPVLGAFLLRIASWHMMFIVLALFGIAAAGLATLYRETLEEKSTGPLLKSWGRLVIVLKNPRFAYLLLIFSMAPMCLLAFIGTAAYIYIDGFGLSEQAFSFIFSFNAVFSMFGPTLYLRLSRVLPVQGVILGCFLVVVLGGTALLAVGDLSPWLFAGLARDIDDVGDRPAGARREPDAGTTGQRHRIRRRADPVQQHDHGAIAVQVVSAGSADFVRSFGTLLVVVGTACAAMWMLVLKRPFVVNKVSRPA